MDPHNLGLQNRVARHRGTLPLASGIVPVRVRSVLRTHTPDPTAARLGAGATSAAVRPPRHLAPTASTRARHRERPTARRSDAAPPPSRWRSARKAASTVTSVMVWTANRSGRNRVRVPGSRCPGIISGISDDSRYLADGPCAACCSLSHYARRTGGAVPDGTRRETRSWATSLRAPLALDQ